VTLYQAEAWTDSKANLKISRLPEPTTSIGTGHGADAGLSGAKRRGQNPNPARGRRMSASLKHTQRQGSGR
jgi:hypothetical protein